VLLDVFEDTNAVGGQKGQRHCTADCGQTRRIVTFLLNTWSEPSFAGHNFGPMYPGNSRRISGTFQVEVRISLLLVLMCRPWLL
jgi:hypothetical protein